MKSSPANLRRRSTAARAFTVPELLLALAIFLMVVAAIVSLQVVGLKLNARAASKLASAAASAKVLNQVRDHVLEANSALVGNGNNNAFTPNGTTGNAVQVFSGTDTNNYLLFFLSTNTDCLYEWNNTNKQIWTIAENVTNESVFETVDFQGNVSSRNQEHYSIRMTLQFAELDYRIPTNSYEYFTLTTQMTPRGQ
ncbi:MAG TPA: hypothetical protein VKV04_25670 [Verrucomicrobiae bacterium]|nr:hypothetical protein [Verrucomicrobiae bacterium]